MRSFQERNPAIIGVIGVVLTVGLVIVAFNYDRLPFFDKSNRYTAYFSEAGGLTPGAEVQVAGFGVGKVEGVALDGPKVLVTFDVNRDILLGAQTEAAVKTKSVLGAKILEVVPRGDEPLRGTIPIERTRPAYQLPDALGDLTAAISGLKTDQISTALDVLATTFRDTPADLKIAVDGVARFSRTLNARDAQLRDLLPDANKVTAVLATRSSQLAGLVTNTNALLAALQEQSSSLDEISANMSAVFEQIRAFTAEHRENLKPAVDKLNGVLAIVDNRKEKIQDAIKRLNDYAMSLGESVSSGPFFKVYLANLLPGQFVQPFVDAAFSDLGLDPNVLLPSQLSDPPVGQPGTPALPVPYPRTGQGGEPRLTLPDAITGNPGDARYPYREPVPAPPPGGPPPGPPAPDSSGPGAYPPPEISDGRP